ncbi:MAG: MFS transporter [Patescibacteria group bacterium]|nr:MFS transporter [Patescibacteria group bacterium]
MSIIQNSPMNPNNPRKTAMHFILLMGMVSLFGDITYEGARSITGPYLAVLGAGAGVVGFVAGFGEFIGYALRLVSGYLSDRTKAYWYFTFIGYGLILSIPFIALTGSWQIAAILIITERLGKAIRTPARDAILSHATAQVGRGWGFGIHEAIDQIGAIIGPLIFSAVFLLNGSYRKGFTLLWIPGILVIIALLIAFIKVPSPEKLETSGKENNASNKESAAIPRIFWFYAVFVFLSVAGFANFQLIAYHLKVKSITSDITIPILYAIAMGVDSVVALIIGKTYDRIGLLSLITIPLLTIPIPFLAFSSDFNLVIISVILWGAVMGIHETIMRAAIADLSPINRRGITYGIFNTLYGGAWFIGGVVMGLLYDRSIYYISSFVVVMEIVSVPLLIMVKKSYSKTGALIMVKKSYSKTGAPN